MFNAELVLAVFQFVAIFQQRLQPIISLNPSVRLLAFVFEQQVTLLAPVIRAIVVNAVDSHLDAVRSGFASGSHAINLMARHVYLPVPGTDLDVFDILRHGLLSYDTLRGSLLYPQRHEEHLTFIPVPAFGVLPDLVWFDAPARCDINEITLAFTGASNIDERNFTEVHVPPVHLDIVVPAPKALSMGSFIGVAAGPAKPNSSPTVDDPSASWHRKFESILDLVMDILCLIFFDAGPLALWMWSFRRACVLEMARKKTKKVSINHNEHLVNQLSMKFQTPLSDIGAPPGKIRAATSSNSSPSSKAASSTRASTNLTVGSSPETVAGVSP